MRFQQVKLTIPRRSDKNDCRAAVTVMPEKHEKPVQQVLVRMLRRIYNERKGKTTK